MSFSLTHWLTAAAALIFVLGLILVLARFMRAAGLAPRQAGQRLRLQEVLALDARRRLVIVRCDGRDVLLLTGGAQELCLGWLPDTAKERPQP